MTTSELLTSFNTGQGKTNAIPEFASIDNGVVSYNSLTANVSQSWLEAFVLMNLHKDLKDASTDRQEKLFKAYNEGRLSLNHSTSSQKYHRAASSNHKDRHSIFPYYSSLIL
jgi:hypothetical protein